MNIAERNVVCVRRGCSAEFEAPPGTDSTFAALGFEEVHDKHGNADAQWFFCDVSTLQCIVLPIILDLTRE